MKPRKAGSRATYLRGEIQSREKRASNLSSKIMAIGQELDNLCKMKWSIDAEINELEQELIRELVGVKTSEK